MPDPWYTDHPEPESEGFIFQVPEVGVWDVQLGFTIDQPSIELVVHSTDEILAVQHKDSGLILGINN